jgi:multiple sugar transport system permease protein
MHHYRREQLARVTANLTLTVIGLAFVGPMMWMFAAAFNPTAQLAFEIPRDPSLANFKSVATWEQLYRPLLNSMVLSVVASFITVVTASMCAYPLSRYRLRFGKFFLYAILLSSGLPIISLMIPVYRLFTKLHFTDNAIATAAFMAGTSLPLAIWLAKNFIDGVPISLEEASQTDGATAWQTMTLIVFPLVRPGMIVLFIFSFIGNWGNFFVPFILFSQPSKQTASVTIYNYFNSLGGVYFGRVAAFAILYSAPAVILYTLISRSLGRSLSFAGAVKE